MEGRVLLASQLFAKALTGVNATVSAESLKLDAANNSYVTGSFTGSFTIDGTTLTSAGSNDIFVAKFNSGGGLAWARQMGSTNIADGDYGRGVAVDANGNVVIIGFFSGATDFGGGPVSPVGSRDVFVAKYDNNGNYLWSRTYGGVGFDLGPSVSVDPAGNVYTIGAFQGRVNFGGTVLDSVGDFDTFLMKFDPNGNPLWAKRLGGVGDDRGFSITTDAAGNTYSTGIFSVIASVIAPGTTLTSTGSTDIFAVKTDTNGNVVWARGYGGLSADTGTSIAVDGAGNVYLTGEFVGAAKFGSINLQNTSNNGTGDAFLARLNPDGSLAWVRNYGGNNVDQGFNVTTDPFGFAYVTGVFRGTANFGGQSLTSLGGFDVFVVKVHPNGGVVDASSFGSSADDQAYQIAAQGANGRFAVVGNYGGPTTIGGVAMPAPSGAFLIHFNNTKPQADFDNIRVTQPAVYRLSTAQWFVRGGNGIGRMQTTYGTTNLSDIPIVGDFDGDGLADPALYRESTAQWFIQRSSNNYISELFRPNFGWAGVDIPVPGDYDGDGKTDPAVYRPTNAQWYVQFSSQNYASVLLIPNGFGWPGVDIPAPGDYDGDGKTDPAVYRPTDAKWYATQSSKNYAGTLLTPNGFGWAGVDIPAPGDYDGSGKTQVAIFRPLNGTYYISQPGGGTRTVGFGGPNYLDLPVQTAIGALKRFNLLPAGITSASRSASQFTAPGTGAAVASLSAARPAEPVASPFDPSTTAGRDWSGLISRRLSAVRPRTVVNQA